MTGAVGAPLVRTEAGAVVGVDWRRTELSDVVVPGVVAARAVMPGDTIRLCGDVLVLSVRRNGVPGGVYVVTRTDGGAEIVHELREGEPVQVLAVGAFDE